MTVVAVYHLDSQLPELGPHRHCSRLPVVRVPYRPGHPFLSGAVYREQLECRDHRSSVCVGAICDYGILREKTSGDSAQIAEDIQGLQAIGQGGCP